MNLVSALYKAASLYQPGIIFIQQPGMEEEISYGDIYRKSLQILGYLQAGGLKSGDELIIQVDNNQHLICIFWACILGKIVPVPLSEGTQTEHKLKFFRICKYLSNPYLICDEKQAARLKAISAYNCTATDGYTQVVDNYLEVAAALSFENTGEEASVSAEDIAYIQFSSGSTGEPKGVCLSHQNLIVNIRDIIDSLQITQKDTLLSWMPLTHDMGIIGFHLVGVYMAINAICIATPLFIRRPLQWMELVSLHRATVLYSPNFGLRYFLNALEKQHKDKWDLTCIRIIVNGAEPISEKLCDQFTAALSGYGMAQNVILTAYGLAEASVAVSVMPPGTMFRSYVLDRRFLKTGDQVKLVDKASSEAVNFVDVGYPVSSCEVRICNDNDEVLPANHIGHIQVKGKNVTKGYYNYAVATKDLFTNDNWLKTGDLGFFVENRLVVTGRLKNIIIINGQNYYPQDIEMVITDAGIVEQGKVVVCGDPGYDKKQEEVIVFVLYKGNDKDYSFIETAITNLVARIIGITVTKVVFVTKIPKTTSGKIQHFALLEQYRNGNFDGSGTSRNGKKSSPSLPEGIDLHTIISSLIQMAGDLSGRTDITAQTNLFDLGINSLQIIQMADKMSAFTGKELPVKVVFDCADIGAIGKYLQETGLADARPLLRLSAPGGYAALSIAQRRILHECQINNSSAAYNIPVIHKIKGVLEVERLRMAYHKIVNDHEILRTSFERRGDDVVQKIHPAGESLPDIHQVDLRRESDPESAAAQLIGAIINKPFVFESPSQFSITIIRTSDNVTQLVFVIHHILTDGWSLEFIFRDLCKYYNKGIAVEDILSGPRHFQYKDFVLWQQELLDSPTMVQHRNYWLQELAQLKEPVDLSVNGIKHDFNRHVITGQYSYWFNPIVTRELGILAADYNTSVFSVLLTLLNLLIYRYTNQRDITIGFDTAGRMTGGMEDLAGYTLNTLFLRVDLTPEQDFSSLLLLVKRKLASAIDHEAYPFEKALEDLQAMEGDSRSLFKILVLFQNFYHKDSRVTFQECIVEKEHAAPDHGFTELLLEFEEVEAGLWLHVQYNKDRYEALQISNLAEHMQNLLIAVSQDRSNKISHYNFLTKKESALLLSPRQHSFDIKRLRLPVHRLFERKVPGFTDAIAIRSGDNFLSYEMLNKRSNIIANYLKNKIAANDRIGFMVERGENMIISMLAILKAGGAYVAIDPGLPTARCQYIVTDSQMKYLMVDDEIQDRLKEHFPESFLLNLADEYMNEGNEGNPVFEEKLSDLAYVIYTSGSTGTPKGVMIEHASLTDYVQYFIYHFDINEQDIFLQQASVSFDTIVEEVFPALCVGGRVIIAKQGAADIGDILGLIKRNNVTVLSTTPLVLNELNMQVDSRISTLRLVISGGDILYPENISQLFQNVALYNTYGPSEGTVCASYHKITSLSEAGLLGTAIGGSFIYILDENMQVMPRGMVGEIYIEGRLARGYMNQPELTAEKFIKSPFDENKRLFRSGDLGRITESGAIAFSGRADFQIKVRGHRVEPEEIEKVIIQCKCVKVVAVIMEKGKDQLTACIVVDGYFNENEIRVFISKFLPYYMIPLRFEVMSRLPLTITGKIDRKALADQVKFISSITDECRAPESMLEEQLLTIVQRILQTNSIGVMDNIFDHGCNSIKSLKIKGAIQKELTIKVTIQDLFIYPSVSLLAGRIAELEVSAGMEITAVAAASGYVLSPGQRRLFLLAEINPQSAAYNEGMIYEMKGSLDPAITKAAFNVIAERHEILRTTFHQTKDHPVQIVHDLDADAFHFFYDDYFQRESPLEEAYDYIDRQLKQPFNLKQGPLFRVMMLKISTDFCLLAVGMHHIITDDWSANIIIREFFEVYRLLLNNLPVLPESPVLQYKDYAHWMHGNLQKISMQQHAGYWMAEFEGVLPLLDICPDFIRPAIKQEEAGVESTRIEKEIFNKITLFCREQEISLFMFLLSGLYILLSRYSGQQDIVIGTAVADRGYADLDEMPGFFINTLPLRMRWEEEDTVTQVLQKVKRVCLNAYTHQSYPFESLIDDLNIKRDLSRSVLFDVFINLSQQTEEIGQLPDNMVCHKGRRTIAGCKYDLEFYFEESQQELLLNVIYDKHLYTPLRITQMLVHLNNVLEAIPDAMDKQVSGIPYLSAPELKRILHDFNDTQIELENAGIPALFHDQLLSGKDKIAICCNDRFLTYQEVNDRADLLAALLIDNYNIEANDIIGLLLDRNENIVIAILAVWKAGATYVPINPDIPLERAHSQMEQAAVGVLITDEVNYAAGLALKERVPIEVFNISTSLSSSVMAAQKYRVVSPALIAYVLFTSGSSGEPKGVEVYHHSVSNIVQGLKQRLSVRPGSSMLSVSSYTFDISVSEFFLPLISGGTLYLATSEQVSDVRLLKELLMRIVPDFMQGTPALWALLVESGWAGNINLTAITCGEALHNDLRSKLIGRCGQLWNLYGPTETTIFSTGTQIPNIATHITIGGPLENTRVYVLDKWQQPVGIGIDGQLYIGGRGVARGYLHQPGLTNQKFIQGIADDPGRFFASGDIVRWLPDGTLEYKGRADDQIKVRGFRIEPAEIESWILKYPGVKTAVVSARSLGDNDQQLIAFVVFEQLDGNSFDGLRIHLRKYLPYYMMPDAYISMRELPLNASGKVDKRLLLSLPAALCMPEEKLIQEPVTRMEKILVEIWREILGKQDISITDNFFDLGGHSLKANKLVSKIYHDLSVEVTLSDVFTHTTVQQMGLFIDKLEKDQYDFVEL